MSPRPSNTWSAEHAIPVPVGLPVPGVRGGRTARLPRHVRVREERDIVAAVRAARDAGTTVRAVGSGGSKNDCYRTGGSTLHLDRYDRVLAIDGTRVVVQGGMTVGALNAVLGRHGLALPTHGEWAGATVAGAVATGTHGGSLSHGIFPSSIAALRLITADGGVLELNRGSELFEHAGVSLGMLGVISTITFDCVTRFHLALEMRAVPFDRYLRDLEIESRRHEFYSAVWIPTARRVITFAANRTDPPATPVRRRERFGGMTFALSLLSRRLGVPAFPDRWFTHAAADACEHILSPIRARSNRVQLFRLLSSDWKAAEFAVPAAGAVETLSVLEEFLAHHRHALTNPIGLRASAGDGFSLSPCYRQETFWIDLFFTGQHGFATALRDLFEARRARCHWGKHVALSPEHLQRQYPRWTAFRETRRALDPAGVFANAFTRGFGL